MKIVAYIKLVYLYLLYYLIGMEEEGFYYRKALYLTEIEEYFSAIKSLKEAEKDLKTSYVWGLLGWCYANVEQFEKSLHYYQLAYKTDKSESIVCGLAMSEAHAGNVGKANLYLELLKPFRGGPALEEYIKRIKNVLKERANS